MHPKGPHRAWPPAPRRPAQLSDCARRDAGPHQPRAGDHRLQVLELLPRRRCRLEVRHDRPGRLHAVRRQRRGLAVRHLQRGRRPGAAHAPASRQSVPAPPRSRERSGWRWSSTMERPTRHPAARRHRHRSGSAPSSATSFNGSQVLDSVARRTHRQGHLRYRRLSRQRVLRNGQERHDPQQRADGATADRRCLTVSRPPSGTPARGRPADGRAAQPEQQNEDDSGFPWVLVGVIVLVVAIGAAGLVTVRRRAA